MAVPVDWPCPDLASRRARLTPDRTAMVDAATGREWTYDELDRGPVAALAGGLRRAGVRPGDRLGVAIGPGVRHANLVHAAARAGSCLVPLPPDAPPAVLADRTDAAALDAVVTTDPDGISDWFDGPAVAAEELDAEPTTAEPHRWHRDDVQWLVFTSGTAGDPRAVELTAGNLVASATASARRLGVEADDRWLACLPMHHVGGLAPVVRTALSGTAVVVQAGFDTDGTAATMTANEVTGVSLVPTMLSRLLDGGWSPPASLRFVLLGGAPASAALVERARAAGVPVWPTYGATETASQVATARPREAVEHPGTVGWPLPGTTVAVVDGSDDPVAPGAVGELVVGGPTVSPGYAADPHATARRFDAAGRFRTRDRGYLDEAGRLWVVGRLDDTVVTGGETVHPSDVEAVLRTHPGVADAAVVGLADEAWGEIVGALVVGTGEANATAADLNARCRARLEAHAVPKVLAFADSLPRTASGSVDRAAVRETLRSSGSAGV